MKIKAGDKVVIIDVGSGDAFYTERSEIIPSFVTVEDVFSLHKGWYSGNFKIIQSGYNFGINTICFAHVKLMKVHKNTKRITKRLLDKIMVEIL